MVTSIGSSTFPSFHCITSAITSSVGNLYYRAYSSSSDSRLTQIISSFSFIRITRSICRQSSPVIIKRLSFGRYLQNSVAFVFAHLSLSLKLLKGLCKKNTKPFFLSYFLFAIIATQSSIRSVSSISNPAAI